MIKQEPQMDFDTMHDIAIRTASALRGQDINCWFQDLYQEIWLLYLRYNPRTRTGCWRMAKSAVISIWRKRKRYHSENINWRRVQNDLPNFNEQIENRIVASSILTFLCEVAPKEFNWLLRYAARNRVATKLELVTAFRYRKKLRQLLATQYKGTGGGT